MRPAIPAPRRKLSKAVRREILSLVWRALAVALVALAVLGALIALGLRWAEAQPLDCRWDLRAGGRSTPARDVRVQDGRLDIYDQKGRRQGYGFETAQGDFSIYSADGKRWGTLRCVPPPIERPRP